jgi:hypothetical protein
MLTKPFYPKVANYLPIRSRAFNEKLIIAHSFKKFPAFYIAQMFIPLFSWAHHWIIYRASCTRSKPHILLL